MLRLTFKGSTSYGHFNVCRSEFMHLYVIIGCYAFNIVFMNNHLDERAFKIHRR